MRLIDADEAYKVLTDYYHHKTEIQHDALKEAIERVPTVDAVEVVRCKDCSWCATVKSFGKEYLYCDAFYDHADGNLTGVSLMVEPDHYCSWGERKNETD